MIDLATILVALAILGLGIFGGGSDPGMPHSLDECRPDSTHDICRQLGDSADKELEIGDVGEGGENGGDYEL